MRIFTGEDEGLLDGLKGVEGYGVAGLVVVELLVEPVFVGGGGGSFYRLFYTATAVGVDSFGEEIGVGLFNVGREGCQLLGAGLARLITVQREWSLIRVFFKSKLKDMFFYRVLGPIHVCSVSVNKMNL